MRPDLTAFLGVTAGSVLLGAPAGLLWSAIAPRYVIHYTAAGAVLDDIESNKAFIGADATYFFIVLALGLVCGGLGWIFARRSGPWTVAALALGGVLAALVAASVGVRPGTADAVKALKVENRTSGSVDLYLGKRGDDDHTHIRSPWAAVGWPVGALSVFIVLALRKPEETD